MSPSTDRPSRAEVEARAKALGLDLRIVQGEVRRNYGRLTACSNFADLPPEHTSPGLLDRNFATFGGMVCDGFEARDAGAMLGAISNEAGTRLIFHNIFPLRAVGLFEACVVRAWEMIATNNHRETIFDLFFKFGDREKLRRCGDLIEGSGPFTLYRGVAGRGPARKVRGYAWTANLDSAIWFAKRFPDLADPAVFRASIPLGAVLWYSNGRQEQEYVVLLPEDVKPKRVWPIENNETR